MKKNVKKFAIILTAIMLLSFSIIGCGGNKVENSTDTSKTGDVTPKSNIKVGIVLSTGGKGDKSFNDAAIEGLELAKKELGIAYKDIQPKNVADDEKSLEFLAKEGYNLVFAVGFMQQEALAKVAPKYPNVKFAIIDSEYGDKTPPNVIGLVFKEHEGSFLAGVLAASMTKTKIVGFVGGMDMALIHRFEGGFQAGVKYIIPDAKILSAYAGTDGSAFNNPDKGKEIALDMISKGADIIYHAAGGTGQGVFEACSTKGIKAIGVDSNQNWVKPGTVIASMLKRVDVAVGNTVKSVADGSYKGGITKVFGLPEDGVALTDLNVLTPEETIGESAEDQKKIKDLKDSIPDEVKTKIEDIKKKIISGEIKVPDWLVEGKPNK